MCGFDNIEKNRNLNNGSLRHFVPREDGGEGTREDGGEGTREDEENRG